MEVEKPSAEQTNGSLKHDLEEKNDDKALKKPSISKTATPQPAESANNQPNGSSADEKSEPEKPAEPEPATATGAPGPAAAPGPSVNPQPVVTEDSSNTTSAPKFSSNVTENEKNEETNEKDNDNDEEEEEKTNEPVEPPLRKVEEDENYDDE